MEAVRAYAVAEARAMGALIRMHLGLGASVEEMAVRRYRDRSELWVRGQCVGEVKPLSRSPQ